MTNGCFRAAVYAKGLQFDQTCELKNLKPTEDFNKHVSSVFSQCYTKGQTQGPFVALVKSINKKCFLICVSFVGGGDKETLGHH